MKAVKLETDNTVEEVDLPTEANGQPSVASLFKALGAEDIEGVTLLVPSITSPGTHLYIDRMGRLAPASELNFIASFLYRGFRGGDFILGPTLVLGFDLEGDEKDVPEKMVDLIKVFKETYL